jgi:hypothetical protein
MTVSVTRFVLPVVAGFFATSHALCDVTMEQSISVEAGGVMSMLASEGTITTAISGNKSRTDNRIKAKSSLINKFAKNLDGSTIVLLDDELMLNLMPAKQQYSELTFAQIRQQMEKGMQMFNGSEGEGGDQGGLPVSEEECEWSEPVLDVNHTKEKQQFGGVKAEQHIITASQVCTVPETGKSCKMTWSLEYWNAKRMPGHKEAADFQENLALKLGGDEMLAMAKATSRGLLAMFKKGWGDVLNETEQMKGFAAKTVMSMEIGGESCTTMSGQPIALDDMWNNAAEAGLDAATQSAASHAGNKVAEETAGALGNSVGGSVAGSAIGAASRELAAGMFKKFGRKKNKQKPAAPTEPANPAAGSVVLFKITSELTAINENDISADYFSAPAGWEKIEAAGF